MSKDLYSQCHTYNAPYDFDKTYSGKYENHRIGEILKESGDNYLVVQDGLVSKKGIDPIENTFTLPTMTRTPPGYWKSDIVYSSDDSTGLLIIESLLRELYSKAKGGTILFFPEDGIGLYPSLYCINHQDAFLKFNKIISDFFIPAYTKFEDPSTWETALSMRKLSEVHSLIGEMVVEGRYTNEKILDCVAEELDFEITIRDINNWIDS